MALIAPTVETIGDAALTNSIIDRSITEIQDELVTNIRENAFRNCIALKKAVFGSVSVVDDRAFNGCTALTTVDFHTSTSFGDYAFNNCSSLNTLILRGPTVCHAVSGTLQNSGIASGNGYIYVPAALVDAYKAHSVWGRYANQIRAIEDYLEYCDSYSWEGVAAAIEKGTYKDVYKIGDVIHLDLGTEGVNMQIAAFDADTLADGSGTAAISWVAKDLLTTTRKMAPALVTNSDGSYQEGTGTIGGWEKCELRTYLNDSLADLFPAILKNCIEGVRKHSNGADTNGNIVLNTSVERVWIPSGREIFGDKTYSWFETEGVQYYFADTYRKKYPYGRTVINHYYFLRTAATKSDYKAVSVSSASISNMNVACTATRYVCLGFCTGRTPT